MEVDAGSAASIINEETYKRISEGNQVKNRPQLETAKVKLRTYTGEFISDFAYCYAPNFLGQ